MRTKLGVNVDHVATVRQARRIDRPDPVVAAAIAELAGADGVTVHLREDRRHIQDRDVRVLRETVKTRLNLEIGLAPEICDFALSIKPDMITLVPEKREEVTTEGGLDAVHEADKIRAFVDRAGELNIPVSLFLDPEKGQIEQARELGAQAVELHTGTYCEAYHNVEQRRIELGRLAAGAQAVRERDMELLAGHGLDYINIEDFMQNVPKVAEVNIGHAIVARAVLVGMELAVREMRERLHWV